MGLFKSSSPEPEPIRLLDPVDPPFEVFRGYTRKEQVTLEINKKILHIKDDKSVVTDDHGAPVVQVEGPAFWLNNYKTVSDPNGNLLFKMRNKKAAILRRFICEDERGTELFRCQRKMALLNVKVHAIVPGTVGDAPTLELVGSKRGFTAEVTDMASGAVVAVISHAFWSKEKVLKNKETYLVTVAPGVDLAIITALCLTWDQSKEDDRHAAAASGGGGG